MLALLLACASGGPADTAGAEAPDCVDEEPPTLTHEPPAGPLPLGVDVPVEVVARDDCGLLYVYLYYRPADDDGEWRRSIALAGAGDAFTATIGGEAQTLAGTASYFEAVDRARNPTTAPARGADEPFLLTFTEP